MTPIKTCIVDKSNKKHKGKKEQITKDKNQLS